MKKYRPYLTLAQLKHLANLSSQDSEISALTRYLQRYILDIDSGYRVANTITQPTIAEKLGFVLPDEKTAYEAKELARYLEGGMNKQEEDEYEKKQGRIL